MNAIDQAAKIAAILECNEVVAGEIIQQMGTERAKRLLRLPHYFPEDFPMQEPKFWDEHNLPEVSKEVASRPREEILKHLGFLYATLDHETRLAFLSSPLPYADARP